jgi:hypothetical protein
MPWFPSKVEPWKRSLATSPPAFGSQLTPASGDWPTLPRNTLASTLRSEAATTLMPERRLPSETVLRMATRRQPWLPVSRIPSV